MSIGRIAPGRPAVKWPLVTRTKDRRDGQKRRPDVLRRMPLSCNVVFDVLRSLAGGEAVEVSLRELADVTHYSTRQVRRALKRLEAAHLIRWETFGPGRGRRSILQVLWRSPSFPHLKGASLRVRDKDYSPSGNRRSSPWETALADSSSAGSCQTVSRLRPRLSARAERWAIAEFRRRLAHWTPERIADPDGIDEDGLATLAIGLDREHVLAVAEREGLEVWEGDYDSLGGPDREQAMLAAAKELRVAVVNAFATALHRAIKRGRIKAGRELAQVVDEVAEVLDQEARDWLWPWLSERMVVDGERAVYAWVGRLVRVAVEGIEEARAMEEARKQEAEERAKVRTEWQELADSGFSFTEQARRMAQGDGQSEVGLNTLPPQEAGTEKHSNPPPSKQRERGAGVSGGRTSAPSAWGMFEWRRMFEWHSMPDGNGYWVLGGKPTANRRETVKFSPGLVIELRQLGKQLEIAEAQGDREKAAELLKRILELRRSLVRR